MTAPDPAPLGVELRPEQRALVLAALVNRVKTEQELVRSEFSTAYIAGCATPDCAKAHHARGYCRACYLRLYKRGEMPRYRPFVATPAAEPIPFEYGSAVLPDRIWVNIAPLESGCWHWQAALDPRGYGVVGVGRKVWRVHRLVHVVFQGEPGPGLELDHYLYPDGGCLGPSCVLHTRRATSRENTLRGNNQTAWNLAKTHCPHGHPYSGSNLYVTKLGHRLCRACNRANGRARNRALRVSAEERI